MYTRAKLAQCPPNTRAILGHDTKFDNYRLDDRRAQRTTNRMAKKPKVAATEEKAIRQAKKLARAHALPPRLKFPFNNIEWNLMVIVAVIISVPIVSIYIDRFYGVLAGFASMIYLAVFIRPRIETLFLDKNNAVRFFLFTVHFAYCAFTLRYWPIVGLGKEMRLILEELLHNYNPLIPHVVSVFPQLVLYFITYQLIYFRFIFSRIPYRANYTYFAIVLAVGLQFCQGIYNLPFRRLVNNEHGSLLKVATEWWPLFVLLVCTGYPLCVSIYSYLLAQQSQSKPKKKSQ